MDDPNLDQRKQLFQIIKPDHSTEFAICEIAARRPGGSIGLLIDEAEGGQGLFPEMEFRLNVGLPLRYDRVAVAPLSRDPHFTVGDLMVPKQIGELKRMPAPSECSLEQTTYIPIAKQGSVYHGFDVNAMNTAARFIVRGKSGACIPELRLQEALEWFNRSVDYGPPPAHLPPLPSAIAK